MRSQQFFAGPMAGLLLAVGSLLAPAMAQEGGQEQWAPLFNGKDLSGWTDTLDNSSDWQVTKDGLLDGRGGGRGNPAVLVSDARFGNFRLRVVFRYDFDKPGGGMVEVRRSSGQGNVTSAYVASTCVKPYPTWDAYPTGSLFKLKNYRYGSPWPPARESERAEAGAGEWHTLEIVARANRIISLVDDRKVAEITDNKNFYRSGSIAITCGGDSHIQIREILIQPLTK